MITIEDFAKLEIKIGTVPEATPMPDADKLLILKVNLGEETRQIVAGIKQHYAPAQITGLQVAVITNLAPRILRGVESYGMILAAGDADTLAVLTPQKPVTPGTQVK